MRTRQSGKVSYHISRGTFRDTSVGESFRPHQSGKVSILLRGIQFTHVQRYSGSTVKMVLSNKFFTLNEAITCVALPNACRRSVRALSECYHNNNGSQTTVVETVKQSWVVHIPRSRTKVSYPISRGKFHNTVHQLGEVFVHSSIRKFHGTKVGENFIIYQSGKFCDTSVM
jgi:hypothetical protein